LRAMNRHRVTRAAARAKGAGRQFHLHPVKRPSPSRR
jgi:hypothetical protein